MNKNRLFVLLKILIVAVLLGVIFFAIDWRDHYEIVSVEGEPVETVYGRIIGRWDQDPVRFVTEISNTPRNVYRSEASSGRTIVIKPGILTYFANVDFGWFGLGAAAFLVFVVVINSRWWWLMRVNGLGVGFSKHNALRGLVFSAATFYPARQAET